MPTILKKHHSVNEENSINAHFPNKHHSVNEENSMIMSTIKIKKNTNKHHRVNKENSINAHYPNKQTNKQTSQCERGKQHHNVHYQKQTTNRHHRVNEQNSIIMSIVNSTERQKDRKYHSLIIK